MKNDKFSRPSKQKTQHTSDDEASDEASPRSELVISESYDGADTLPLITQLKEVEAHDGRLVRVAGKYIESDVRMKPVGTPRYLGHVSIVLADNTRVSLFPVWQHDACRPQAEIDQFKDQDVEVVGTIYRRSPIDPQGGASPLGPCLTDVAALYRVRS